MAIQKSQTIDPVRNLRDVRRSSEKIAEAFGSGTTGVAVLGSAGFLLLVSSAVAPFADLLLILGSLYFFWLIRRKTSLPLRLPSFANCVDPHNKKPGGGKGMAEGILFIGNHRHSSEEMWLTNSDARTHILYLGTTGAGKTEGLKSLVSNALCWGSGFIYIDGKADTDLWAALYALARRFGRDDDLLVLNYMTGNSDEGAPSNSLNPFSSGSASYLTNLMVSLMDEAGGDNAMWKGRAISLMSALMPALTYKRAHGELLLDVGVVRDNLTLQAVVRLSRDPDLPDRITRGLKSYLETLPGYLDDAFDDDGRERPPAPDEAPFDVSTCLQQHGYLSMQFTRTLQSLADEYGYIFQLQIADIDMVDVVLNRRILVTLIPALEKSADEAANLGKIVAAAIKGMMGSTLGANVEGDWEGIIENKQTRSSSPFMTVFDEVGYYTAQGMAVMAAQARSLGFSLVFSAQDLPAMEKRVREEARSITANCNLKLFGKLEDSQDTKEFFEKTVGTTFIAESTGFQDDIGNVFAGYQDQRGATIKDVAKARFGELKSQKEGEVHLCWGSDVYDANMFYANPKKVKAIRIQKFLKVSPEDMVIPPRDKAVDVVRKNMRSKTWTAMQAAPDTQPVPDEIAAMIDGFRLGRMARDLPQSAPALAVAAIAHMDRSDEDREAALGRIRAEDAPEPEPEKAPEPKAPAAPPPPVAAQASPEPTEPAAGDAVPKPAETPPAETPLVEAAAPAPVEAAAPEEEAGGEEEAPGKVESGPATEQDDNGAEVPGLLLEVAASAAPAPTAEMPHIGAETGPEDGDVLAEGPETLRRQLAVSPSVRTILVEAASRMALELSHRAARDPGPNEPEAQAEGSDERVA